MTSQVEQIKEKLDIVELIGSYVKLEKAGRNYKGRCPFHNEKTPSFSVSPERQFFYCFGCQAKGDIFSFVEKFESLDFPGALKMLAERAGVELTNNSFDSSKNKKDKEKSEKLYEIMENATSFFEANLKADNKEALEAREYLKGRGINEESVTKWRIGFARDEWRGVHDRLLFLNSKREDVLESGMIKKVDGEEKYYDTFRDRIMFPIFDAGGRVIAFSGRILHDRENAPKYINSPETELFHKSDVLYGLNFAKNDMRRLDYCVLVEGQMDLVMSHQAGVHNTVASSGTALTESHLQRIKKITKRIIVGFDSDEAGIKAGKRAAELALSLGMEAKIASLPKGEDPASVVKGDLEAWKEYLKKSVDIVEFSLNQALATFKAGIPLAKAVTSGVVPYIALIQDEILKSEYVNLVSRKTGIPNSSILLEIGKVNNKTKETVSNVGTNNMLVEPLLFSSEEMLAGIILWQESLPDPSVKTSEIRARFEGLLGSEASSQVLENSRFDKDTLVFEMENRFGDLDISRVIEEKFIIIESRILRERLGVLSRSLDSASTKEERDKIELEIREISKKLAMNN